MSTVTKQDYTNLEQLPDILTAEVIAKYVHISKWRVYELMKISPEAGGIPTKCFGRTKRVLKSDLVRWLEGIGNV
jgi:hypothetical protein